MEDFKRKFLPYVANNQMDEWDLLALAQHHGLPTRLLDWSYNALTSLWFADKEECETIDRCKKDGVVWVFAPDLADYHEHNSDVTPYSIKVTKVFRPKYVAQRISSQAGLFTAHVLSEDGKAIRVERHKRYSSKLIKLKIIADSFPKIRQQLQMLGVNNASMVPDLDGLCKHLEWRFFYSKDEKPVEI